jgi:peptidoglycan/xylan/chitin deacetylase (PgdA/CDA1 family)
MTPSSRRRFLGSAAAGLGLAALGRSAIPRGRALVAITLDLEMSRNFPTWDQTHWDYEKGNLDDATKRYALEACRRVRRHGGVAHCFVVGRTLEQAEVGWLRAIVAAGHAVGNHTYDHVNIKARSPEELQYRFQRAPWLIQDRTPAQVIRDNIQLTNTALFTRLAITPAGFRTPGGFPDGLRDRPDLQQMLRELGFTWVSSLYPRHALGPAGQEPTEEVLRSLVEAQHAAQPFVYPSGLVEIPMSPISDIGAFRNGRWSLASFLTAVRRCLQWCLDEAAAFDFLCHPSCLGVVDPEFRAVELICDMVRQAGERAALVDLNTIAESHAKPQSRKEKE